MPREAAITSGPETAQVVATANRYYRGRAGLLLLCIDPSQLDSELRYEQPAPLTAAGERTRDGQGLFPHVYGPIDLESVVRVISFEPNAPGEFAWPTELDDLR
jgi:uncharacterized protein (DUF952 family)